jgi:type VI secretion system secreted protein VgrG
VPTQVAPTMPYDAHQTLHIEGLSTSVRVLAFEGHEGISQLFEFVVTIASREAIDVDSGAMIGKKAALTIHPLGIEHGTIHAIVSRVEEEKLAGAYQYHVTLVPWAWMLLQKADSRIFQEMTVPQIVAKVLERAGYTSGTDFRMSLQQTYAARDYCVQYRELDWDFVCRLLEDEGICFFFEQTESGHVLVMADTTPSSSPIAGDSQLIYRPLLGAIEGTAYDSHVSRFHLVEEVRPGKVTLRDWNFLKPALQLESTKAGGSDTALEIYDYPGDYTVPDDGLARAGVRVEELAVGRKTGRGDSGCPRLGAGFTFTLAEHPEDRWNAQYLVTRIEHWGAAPEMIGRAEGEEATAPYANRFEVIPASVAYRPPRVTRRPRIHGVQTAIVVGPPGEEIYTDAHARVKVQFHWDRLGKHDDKSSCWVRVAQLWAGPAFGTLFLPRIADEVVVAFEEGDPDRPLVVGRVYHGTNVPPYTLPDEKTKSTIKSHSSPKGEGSNELRFEDKKGSEEVFLHAQKDWTIGVEHDKAQKVGHDETLEVGHDRKKTIDNDQTATVSHDDTLTVKNDQTVTVKHDRSVTVENDHTEDVQGNQSLSVGKAQTVALKDKQEITVDKTRSLTVTGDVTETYQAKLTLSVTDDVSETLKAKRTVDVTGDVSEKLGGKHTLTIQGDASESVSGKKSLTVTGDVTITSGASTVTIKPSGEITISGAQIKIDATGPLKIHGATIDVQSDASYGVKAPMVNGNADAVYTIKGAVVTVDGQMINLG